MANEKILIVGNSAETINFRVDDALESDGYQTFVADDAKAGLALALEQHPDLILFDFDTDGVGTQMLDELAARDVRVPSIVIASQDVGLPFGWAFQAGIKAYLQKPFEPQTVLAAIDNTLTESRLRKERDHLGQRLTEANERNNQHFREFNTLFSIGKSVTSLLDQDKLLPRLVEAAIYLTNAEEGALLLVDEKADELYMAAFRGIDYRVAQSFRLPVQNSLAGQVLASGQPAIFTGEDLITIKPGYVVRSLIYVPLKTKGRVIGVLGVNNKQQTCNFSNHQLRLLSALADYAAIFLESMQVSRLAENEQTKLTAILDEIAEPVIVISGSDNKAVTSNAAFCRTFELTADAVKDQPLSTIIHNSALQKLVAASFDNSASYKIEIPFSDGRTFYVATTPIPNVGRAVIMQDVTHLKKLDRMKSDFVSTLSQDLRTPINSIMEYAQMLDSAGELNERQVLFADRIVQGTVHISMLIDNLLDLGSIEAGIEAEKTIVDLAELTADVMANFQERAGRKRQNLIGHITGEPALVFGNARRLRQVIVHLIDNAIRHTPERGQISTLVQTDSSQVVFKIEDSGPGIPPADLPFIFDKFFRVKSHNRSGVEGTGLGLAICRSIVEKYDGYIRAENQPDGGTVFTFTLPMVSADQILAKEEFIEPLAA